VSDDTETGAVKVSMRDIYYEVQRQGRLLEKIANSLPDSESKIDDHEARIRKLEMRMGWAVGGFGLVAAVMPWIVERLDETLLED
tara:strand:+ start:8040 stop:8294 length:255 start_codon:yes stop_codon:yes gene_type:complete